MIKVLLGIPVALIGALILTIAFYEGRKAYWDWRVEQMCEEDGGLTIPNNGSESRTEATTASKVIPLHPGSPIDVEYSSIEIQPSNPHVFRGETRYVRREDKQLLAVQVKYGRSGGDFLSFHQSSFGCPRHETIKSQLNILLNTEERK